MITGTPARAPARQPECQQCGTEQESSQAPEIDDPDALADGQRIPDEAAEKGRRWIQPAQGKPDALAAHRVASARSAQA